MEMPMTYNRIKAVCRGCPELVCDEDGEIMCGVKLSGLIVAVTKLWLSPREYADRNSKDPWFDGNFEEREVPPDCPRTEVYGVARVLGEL